jgi:LysM repeat protein
MKLEERMSKKLYLLITLVVVLVLAACSRSATTTTSVATATQRVQGSIGTTSASGNATEDPMARVKLFSTQTAMAGGQGVVATPTTAGGVVVPTLTPVPGTIVNTPVTGATSAVVTTPYPTPVKPASYTLQTGEYPFCIARRYNVDPSELLDLNNLGENDLLQPGTVLNIPQTGSVFPGTRALHTHPATYTVTTNDTIYRIACYFGDVDPMAIATVNHLVAPYSLTVGTSLIIP